MDLHEIVMKLVGPVQAVGETNEDQRRLVNIGLLTDLVDDLIQEIDEAARDVNRPEASMRAIGKVAAEYLNGLTGGSEVCPECGGAPNEIQYYPGDAAVPECHYKTCSACEHQWGHE